MACLVSWIVCILSIFLPIPQEVDWVLDICRCIFQACLQSQAEHELDIQKDGAERLNTKHISNQGVHTSQPKAERMV